MAAKVLFRRAKSLFEDFQYDDALRDATQATLIVGDDKVRRVLYFYCLCCNRLGNITSCLLGRT